MWWGKKPTCYTRAMFYILDFSEIVFMARVLILKATSLIFNSLPLRFLKSCSMLPG